jgi:rhamnosyltransferase
LHDSRVCAVVLTYQPNVSSLVALLQCIVPQVDTVLLVDNGSSATIRSALVGALPAFPSVRTVMLEDNVGVGAGHNRGISLALQEGFPFVVILDQDSTPATDMIARLRLGYETASRGGTRVAAVGPRFVQKLTGDEAPFIRLGLLRFRKVSCKSEPSGLVRADFLISSGSLIPQEAFREVGLMREDLFIDQVDTEWFLRARQQGWQMYGVCAARMEHALGDKTLRVWIGRWREIPLHSPLRHYYSFRNSIYLYLRTRYPLRWKLADGYRLTGMLVIFTLLLPDRFAHLRMMLRGAWHGVLGRLGRYDLIGRS